MEPEILYARARDGAGIAYWAIGDGPPFVEMPPIPYSHVEQEWRIPEIRAWYERLAQTVRLIRYDGRRTGLSDHSESSEFTLDSFVLDLDAVIEALQLPPFVLFAPFNSGPVAIRYAVTHPGRIERLILWCTYAEGSQFFSSQRVRAFDALIDTSWQMATETFAHDRVGWSTEASASQFAALIRASISPETQRGLWQTCAQIDVSGDLAHITVPTLVLHRREFRWLDVDYARNLASRIDGASMRLLDGGSLAPYLGDVNSVLNVIGDFLGLDFNPVADASSGIRVVLFTDLVGHTEMMRRLGDEGGRDVLREHERITRDVLRRYGGSEVKTLGDGFMASFGRVTKAIDCAIAIQRAFAARGGEPLDVRIGLNAGEPIEEEGDLFGSAVIIAARIAAKAGAAEILIPEPVRHLLAGKGYTYVDRGETMLKGFDDAVRLYSILWRA